MKKFKALIIAFVTLAFVITACGSVTETVTAVSYTHLTLPTIYSV